MGNPIRSAEPPENRPPPTLGQDTVGLLAEIDLGDADIKGLRDSGVIA